MPILQLSSFDKAVEGAHGWAAMNLVVDSFLWNSLDRRSGSMSKVPFEQQCHFSLWIPLSLLDLISFVSRQIFPGFAPDLIERPLEITFFENGTRVFFDLLQRFILIVELCQFISPSRE